MSNFLPDDLFKEIDITSPMNKLSSTIGDTVGNLKNESLDVVGTSSMEIKKGVAFLSGADTQFIKTLSDYKSTTLNKLNSLLTTLTAGMLNTNDFMNLITLENGLKLNSSGLMNKITSLLGFDITNIGGFANQYQNQLMNQLNTLSGGYLGSYLNSNGVNLNITQNINKATSQSVYSVLSKLGIADYDNAYSSAVSNSFYHTMTYEAANAGLVDAYKPLYESYANTTDADQSMIQALEPALANGDLTSVAALTALVSPAAQPAIGATYPTAAEQLVSKFIIDPTKTAKDYDSLGDALTAACVALNGENWWKVYTENWGWVPNLLIGSQFSDDILKVWMNNTDMAAMMVARYRFSDKSARDVFLNDFPQTPL